MKTLLLAGALSLSSLAVATAAPAVDEQSTEPSHEQTTRVAEGVFDRFWGHRERHHEERHGHHGRHWREDDDDDDGRQAHRRGGANRTADPNAADAPVPDNGVFNNKSRPKVEVQ
jgi:hypothetical protein